MVVSKQQPQMKLTAASAAMSSAHKSNSATASTPMQTDSTSTTAASESASHQPHSHSVYVLCTSSETRQHDPVCVNWTLTYIHMYIPTDT